MRIFGEHDAVITARAQVRTRLTARRGTWLLRGLVALGVIAEVYWFFWWQSPANPATPWGGLALALLAAYSLAQLFGQWGVYLGARWQPPAPPPPGNTVDVFVTACREPYALVQRYLMAACAMRGPHSTWLLDDGADLALADLARQLGAGYLTRTGRADAKAGNLNAALARTDGDIVVIFDIDHAPSPDFLARTLGYFADPTVGFVQVMLTFDNAGESWVARAASESTLDFFNATEIGMDGLGSATLVGSNALIRRTALTSIGGYRPGLAEDLATSLALHAAGWQSRYVAEPLAPGLAPPDLPAWFTQQLKWARGVFEVMLTAAPRAFPRLTWGQRLSYGVRFTYYWIGPIASLHLLFTIALLNAGGHQGPEALAQYLARFLPLAVLALLIRQVALCLWRHPSIPMRPLWRAVMLVYATWPIYTAAWVLAVLRVPVAFRPTPKTRTGRLNPLWLVPQLTTVVLLIAGISRSLATGGGWATPLLLVALCQGVAHTVPLWQGIWPSLRST
jgi:cellulose synthase (UDP-forming)